VTRHNLLVTSDGEDKTKLAEAKDFLQDYLANGRRPFQDCVKAAKAERISLTTLRRAKKDLRVLSPGRVCSLTSRCGGSCPTSPTEGQGCPQMAK
jgi:hypothetical protein